MQTLIILPTYQTDQDDNARVIEEYAKLCKLTHADDKAAKLDSEARQIRAIREKHRAEKSPEQTLSPTSPIPTQAEQSN